MSKTMTRRGIASRQRLMEAASTLFHRQGVNATSVDDILSRCDMGKSQFYHYFATKDELVCAAVEWHMEQILEYLEPHTASVRTIEDIEAWFVAYTQLSQRYSLLGCPVGIIAAEEGYSSPAVRQAVIRALNSWVAALTPALARLELGRGFEPNRAAEFIGATIQGSMLVGRVFQSPYALANAGQQIKRYLESFQK